VGSGKRKDVGAAEETLAETQQKGDECGIIEKNGENDNRPKKTENSLSYKLDQKKNCQSIRRGKKKGRKMPRTH